MSRVVLSCVNHESPGVDIGLPRELRWMGKPVRIQVGSKSDVGRRRSHNGDSRVYLVRGRDLRKLTEDHSLVAEQVRRGLLTEAEAEHSPQQNIITRAIGIEATIEVTLSESTLISGDCLLLCSDGLTRGVRPDKILDAIRAAPDPQTASDELVVLANQAGGEDNTTVIVIMTCQEPGANAGGGCRPG